MTHCTHFLPLAYTEDSIPILNLQLLRKDTQLKKEGEKQSS